jgi:putative DNA primase/helicase
MSLELVPDLDGIVADPLPSPAIYGEPCTDYGNARRLVELYGRDLLYLAAARRWYIWDGRRFRPDETGRIWQLAKATARTILEEAARANDKDDARRLARHALASENRGRLQAMIQLAESEAEIAIVADDLDADPYLLTVGNGTLDLRTGTLRKADPADRITLATSIEFDPEQKCPTWEKFLREIYADDLELVEFDRRWIGYCLTGDTSEHALRISHGPSGRNGKSVRARVLAALLGDLCRTADFQTFLRQTGDGPREDIARLAGARLVIANEAAKGRRLDEATVKSLTGGDRIVARHLYAASFEFTPRYKIEAITNDRPRVDGGDTALWSRLREVPYRVSFAGREDRDLPEKLLAELPGILTWAVQGCLDWQEQGLGTAAAVEEATADYQAEEDHLGAFLQERLQTGDRIETKRFRQLYESYCEETGEKPLAASTLGRELSRREVKRGGTGRRYYLGLQERSDR